MGLEGGEGELEQEQEREGKIKGGRRGKGILGIQDTEEHFQGL